MAITKERSKALQESRQGAHQVTHQALVRHFEEQVRRGIDEPMQRGNGLRPVRLSELLAGCDQEARALLFTACVQAKKRDRAAFVEEMLRAFVDRVALHYADDAAPEGATPPNFDAAACHGFSTAPTFLARDYYHCGDVEELADERFEARKAEVLQSTLDCLRAGLAQMSVGAGASVPADDEQIVAAMDDRVDAGQYPSAAIIQALRGDLTALWKWAEEAFEQAADCAADRVRRGSL